VGAAQLRDFDLSAWHPNPFVFTAATLLLLASYFFSAAIWGRVVVDLGGPRIRATDAVRLFMIANLGRYVPGKVWQIAGLAALAKGRGIPASTATGAAVLGQGIALAAATAVGMGALLTGPEPLPVWGRMGAALIVLGAAAASVPKLFNALAALWFRLAGTEPPETLNAVHALRWFALYFVNWSLYALSFWLLVVSFDASASLVPVASAFAAAYVLGYIAIFAPAGVGIREASLIALLTPHLGLTASSALSIIARLWTTAVEVVPAGAFWMARVSSGAAGGEGGRDG
jgi:glycosyltransferase 2 family protein